MIQEQICDNLNEQKFACCLDCGEELSKSEIKNGEDTCYPCQKGNR